MYDKELKIRTPYLLLCEGADEYYFLIWYLKFLINTNKEFENIQVIDYGGINELTNKLKILSRMQKFDIVKKIGIIRDAETNWQRALDSVNRSVISSGIAREMLLDEPYLLPNKDGDNWQNGTLEDLCVKLLKKQFIEKIASSVLLHKSAAHLAQLVDIRGKPFGKIHKNLLHTIFSGTDAYVGLKIGEAANAGAFAWESASLDCLKSYLKQLLE